MQTNEEFEKIYKDQSAMVFSIAYHTLLKFKEATIVVEKVFDKLLNTDKQINNLRTWLAHVTISYSLKEATSPKLINESPESLDFTGQTQNLNAKVKLQNSLSKLSAKQRAVYILKSGYNFSTHEISQLFSTDDENMNKYIQKIIKIIGESETEEKLLTQSIQEEELFWFDGTSATVHQNDDGTRTVATIFQQSSIQEEDDKDEEDDQDFRSQVGIPLPKHFRKPRTDKKIQYLTIFFFTIGFVFIGLILFGK